MHGSSFCPFYHPLTSKLNWINIHTLVCLPSVRENWATSKKTAARNTWQKATLYSKCVAPMETVSFVFPNVLMFPSTRENKTNYSFPKEPCIKCFVIYLDFSFNNHMAKACWCIRHPGNNCAIVALSGYIWIWSGAHDQKSTNHSADFVEWKSR